MLLVIILRLLLEPISRMDCRIHYSVNYRISEVRAVKSYSRMISTAFSPTILLKESVQLLLNLPLRAHKSFLWSNNNFNSMSRLYFLDNQPKDGTLAILNSLMNGNTATLCFCSTRINIPQILSS